MNNWTEIKIEVNSADIDKAGDIANVVVPYGIYIEDYTNLEQTVEDIAHIDLIDEDLLKKAYATTSSCLTAPRRIGATTGKSTFLRSTSAQN